MEKRLIIYLSIFLIIIISSFFLIFEFYKSQINECTKQPLVYGSKQLSKQFNYEFQGIGFFSIEGSPLISFNSTSITISKS